MQYIRNLPTLKIATTLIHTWPAVVTRGVNLVKRMHMGHNSVNQLLTITQCILFRGTEIIQKLFQCHQFNIFFMCNSNADSHIGENWHISMKSISISWFQKHMDSMPRELINSIATRMPTYFDWLIYYIVILYPEYTPYLGFSSIAHAQTHQYHGLQTMHVQQQQKKKKKIVLMRFDPTRQSSNGFPVNRLVHSAT